MGKKGISEFQKLEPNTLVQDLILNIENELPKFTKSDEYVEILYSKKNENQHSSALCVFMNNRCEDYVFMTETQQYGSRSVDIGVYKGHVLFFTIEAKILPTPKDSNRNYYEYVHGRGGGIQRFKDENHGLDHRGNLIPINGLIAYIKEKDFKYWHEKINKWILDAEWNDDERLEKIKFDSTAKLESEHLRNSNSKVTLFHFWVYVANK
jgi:hypothetical protein